MVDNKIKKTANDYFVASACCYLGNTTTLNESVVGDLAVGKQCIIISIRKLPKTLRRTEKNNHFAIDDKDTHFRSGEKIFDLLKRQAIMLSHEFRRFFLCIAKWNSPCVLIETETKT
ncbi:hypothetical protein CDAR_383201 [Caerostris darwini]|uniref:Uncharacterized protein n=1 Tax=Caerostris darwini TaxID=1538125 RepID=A0AAV4NVT8_9ARAC|nr:hypothetical protein CDAR_383201 [Caerostris darwini]